MTAYNTTHMRSGHAASLSMAALLVEPGEGGGSFAKGPEGYERKAVRTGLSLHGRSVGQPGMGSSTGDFEIWLKGALRVESVSLSLGALCREPGGRTHCWGP